MSILIVDPEITSPEKVRSAFMSQGFQFLDIVKTSTEAWAYIDSRQGAVGIGVITMIVVNNILDEDDGFEFCKKVRETSIGKRVYLVVLVSSEKNATAIEAVKHCGADDYSVKPYDGTEFLQHLITFSHQHSVMLVEDDPTLRMLMSSLLSRYAVELILCEDGIQAYNLVNDITPPKLVFMDIGLPNMNGLQLVKHIRGKPSWKNTPIIMLTASTSASDVTSSLAAGANEYIIKPFQASEFVKRVDKYFGDIG